MPVKKLSKFRQAFMDRFINRALTPKEELFALANAYQHSKGFRVAAAYADTDRTQRHTIAASFGIQHKTVTCSYYYFKRRENRADEDFGNKLREFIYNSLQKADSFKPVKIKRIAA